MNDNASHQSRISKMMHIVPISHLKHSVSFSSNEFKQLPSMENEFAQRAIQRNNILCTKFNQQKNDHIVLNKKKENVSNKRRKRTLSQTKKKKRNKSTLSRTKRRKNMEEEHCFERKEGNIERKEGQYCRTKRRRIFSNEKKENIVSNKKEGEHCLKQKEIVSKEKTTTFEKNQERCLEQTRMSYTKKKREHRLKQKTSSQTKNIVSNKTCSKAYI